MNSPLRLSAMRFVPMTHAAARLKCSSDAAARRVEAARLIQAACTSVEVLMVA